LLAFPKAKFQKNKHQSLNHSLNLKCFRMTSKKCFNSMSVDFFLIIFTWTQKTTNTRKKIIVKENNCTFKIYMKISRRMKFYHSYCHLDYNDWKPFFSYFWIFLNKWTKKSPFSINLEQ
jgi:hypothetical protein